MKRLVLAGGGHAHVEVLRAFGDSPMSGVEIVLVSPRVLTPYSGMLPGLVAGHYTHRDCHIALRPLAAHARARFLETHVTGIDAVAGNVNLGDGTRLAFDVLSLDVGSTPPLQSIEGAASVGTAVKPVDRFLGRWEGIASGRDPLPSRIAIVGGGAGGVEIALSMQFRLARETRGDASFVILNDGQSLLPGHAAGVRARLARILGERGLRVRHGSRVVRAGVRGLVLSDGHEEPADWVVWATGAAAPSWLVPSGLGLDDRGFLAVDEHLRSVSHPNVFGAGDVASMREHPRPKSGVYAVRQGPPLAANLRRALQAAPLVPYVPQRRTLSLIGTGGRHAVASWGPLALSGRWVWRWKDAIDRRFMRRYRIGE